MLKKLLKYDLKYMIKNMSVFYILCLIGAILVRIFDICPTTPITSFAYSFSIGFLISMIFSVILNTVIRSWVLFKNSIFGDEGYLTNTLPVTKTEIYESRFIKATIFLIVSLLIVVVSLIIGFYNVENMEVVKTVYHKLVAGINYSTIQTTLIVISLFVIIFLELLNGIQSGFFGVILGHRHEDKKTLFSFIDGSLMYFVSQMVILIVLFISGAIYPDLLNVFKTNPTDVPFNILVYISLIAYLIVTVIINYICVKCLKKGVNLE